MKYMGSKRPMLQNGCVKCLGRQIKAKGDSQPKTNYDSVSSTKSDDVGVRPDIFVMRLSSYS